jgi:hypothetical protein
MAAKMFAIGNAVFASPAAAGGVEAYRIAGLDVCHPVSNGSDRAGAIAAEDMGKWHRQARETSPNREIGMIERCGFELNDGIAPVRQLGSFAFLVAKFFDAAMLVNLYCFQERTSEIVFFG